MNDPGRGFIKRYRTSRRSKNPETELRDAFEDLEFAERLAVRSLNTISKTKHLGHARQGGVAKNYARSILSSIKKERKLGALFGTGTSWKMMRRSLARALNMDYDQEWFITEEEV